MPRFHLQGRIGQGRHLQEIEEKCTANRDAAWAELRRTCATCATPRVAWTELVAAMSSVKFSQEWTVTSIA